MCISMCVRVRVCVCVYDACVCLLLTYCTLVLVASRLQAERSATVVADLSVNLLSVGTRAYVVVASISVL